jgi:peptidoglycan/xylan/chitin deacetylase (PgdA/CDA1 family)
MSAREYGPAVGTPLILGLLEREGIPASFYVPGYIAETHEELMRDIQHASHEIAHHGSTHEPPATLTTTEEADVLDRGIAILERITGERPKGYRSPSWELSNDSLDLLAERGFVYDSSLMGGDVPYAVGSPGKRLVEKPVQWELDDAPYFTFAPSLGARNVMASPEHVYQVWSAAFEGAHHYGTAFVLTMHPYIVAHPGRLRMLERLIGYMKGFPGVEFARAIDLAESFDMGRG